MLKLNGLLNTIIFPFVTCYTTKKSLFHLLCYICWNELDYVLCDMLYKLLYMYDQNVYIKICSHLPLRSLRPTKKFKENFAHRSHAKRACRQTHLKQLLNLAMKFRYCCRSCTQPAQAPGADSYFTNKHKLQVQWGPSILLEPKHWVSVHVHVCVHV